jgi:hypothetical protein
MKLQHTFVIRASGRGQHAQSAHSEVILGRYKSAFGEFSEQEMPVLDGVILEPVGKR